MPDTSSRTNTRTVASAAARNEGGLNPLRRVLDLFSSIWLGVTLLTLLFIYSSIGSAGVATHPWIFDPAHWKSVREMRAFEMTEFEWFTWWPFNLLLALICVNLIVATLRRIPFNVINLGVWMIHTGIITLALGSVWYFGTKIEGDAPVIRRRLVIESPNAPKMIVPALPGASATVGEGDDGYVVMVGNIDPRWELLSGDDKGERAYKVSVIVRSKGGAFVRDLIANRPQYTQDLIITDDPQQPLQRAVNAIGKPLVDEALKISLEYEPQQWFYLTHSRALYLREAGAKQWTQRPIGSRGVGGLPRYNDHIASADDLWLPPRESEVDIDPIDVVVPPSEPGDPLPGVTLHVSGYLQYAAMDSRWNETEGAALNPMVAITMTNSRGQGEQHELAALDPARNGALHDDRGTANLLFQWASTPAELERVKTRVDAVISFSFPGSGKTVDETITATLTTDPNLPFKPIEGTEYAYRVKSLQDNVNFGKGLEGVAIVEIKSPQRTFTRWVFADASFNRDLAMVDDAAAQHEAEIDKDINIESVYRKGTYPPAPIMIIAGPEERDLLLLVTPATGQPKQTMLQAGEPVELAGGVMLQVDRYAPHAVEESRPLLIPDEQRDRQMGEMMSMICVDLPRGARDEGVFTKADVAQAWLPYHHFAYANSLEVLRRFPWRPKVVTLADGRRIELMFGRERRPLPAPVALDDFAVDTHIGGFSGQPSSILDWKSLIRFQGDDGEWLPEQTVRVNKPSEFQGLSFFQAQWDPPEPPRSERDLGSAGLNYTVLGVGNRNGVNVMLAGCIIAVTGMIYSFYCKPIIKRRRQQSVYAQVREARQEVSEFDRMVVQPQPVGSNGDARKLES